METDQVMKQIEAEVKGGQPEFFVCCPNCGKVSPWRKNIPAPSKCSGCGAENAFGIGKTEAEAKDRAGQVARAAMTPPVTQPAPAQPPQPAAEPPKQEPAKTEPPKRQRKPQAAPVNQVAAYETPTAEHEHPDRASALLGLVNKFNLNAIKPTKVGTATVYSMGFTEWIEKEGKRVPMVTVKEPTDDAASFRELLNAARKKNGRVCVDVARLTGFDASLSDALFNYTLDASTFTPTGPVAVKTGDKVEFAAKLSSSGLSLIWSVIRVIAD